MRAGPDESNEHTFVFTAVPTHESGHVDGVLGLDILLGHKAVINCRTKLVFFKVDPARQMNLSSIAASEKFTRIPLRREENGALTVPCSIRGESTRLLVDTGAFVTTFDQTLFKSLGIGLEDIVFAELIYRRAIDAKVGRPLAS